MSNKRSNSRLSKKRSSNYKATKKRSPNYKATKKRSPNYKATKKRSEPSDDRKHPRLLEGEERKVHENH